MDDEGNHLSARVIREATLHARCAYVPDDHISIAIADVLTDVLIKELRENPPTFAHCPLPDQTTECWGHPRAWEVALIR
jgi:hypothetical protein